MIKVKVKVFSSLRKHVRGLNKQEPVILEIPGGSRVIDILKSLGIASDAVGVVLINGNTFANVIQYEAADGDTVSVFPKMFGG